MSRNTRIGQMDIHLTYSDIDDDTNDYQMDPEYAAVNANHETSTLKTIREGEQVDEESKVSAE